MINFRGTLQRGFLMRELIHFLCIALMMLAFNVQSTAIIKDEPIPQESKKEATPLPPKTPPMPLQFPQFITVINDTAEIVDFKIIVTPYSAQQSHFLPLQLDLLARPNVKKGYPRAGLVTIQPLQFTTRALPNWEQGKITIASHAGNTTYCNKPVQRGHNLKITFFKIFGGQIACTLE